jgi:hypothetical protein
VRFEGAQGKQGHPFYLCLMLPEVSRTRRRFAPLPIRFFRSNPGHVTHSSIRSTAVRKSIAIIILAAGLAACGVISTLVDGFKYAKAVEADLRRSVPRRRSILRQECDHSIFLNLSRTSAFGGQ